MIALIIFIILYAVCSALFALRCLLYAVCSVFALRCLLYAVFGLACGSTLLDRCLWLYAVFGSTLLVISLWLYAA